MNLLFSELTIKEEIKKAISFLNLTTTTDIQNLTIPKIITGIDVLGQAQTGTGKTFAFAIPVIEQIDIKQQKTQSIILCPTRELALQVFKETLKLVKFLPQIKIALIVGGESYHKQFQALENTPHVIVATPGRLIDHLKRKKINLQHIQKFVLDEADEMLKMGFKEELDFIFENLNNEKQIILFSATISSYIQKIAEKFLKKPHIIKVKKNTLTAERITQNYFLVNAREKLSLLERFLDQQKIKQVLIFVNTKRNIENIADFLNKKNYNAGILHGDLKQNQRNQVLNKFKNQQTNILIATDVAARGIDIVDLELVINFDLPQHLETYVHRIGRTGRAGKTGTVFNFISSSERRKIILLEKYTGSKLNKKPIPDSEMVFQFQKKIAEEKISNMLKNKKEEDNLTFFNLKKNTLEEKEEFLNTLLHYFKPTKKIYENIKEFKNNNSSFTNNYSSNRFNRSSRSNNFSDRFSKSDRFSRNKREKFAFQNDQDFHVFEVNLGKKENFSPISLFTLLKENYNIFGNKIGNIKHFFEKTTFELKKDFASKITKSDRKIFSHDKEIKINLI